jgi:hypothetical protein
MLGCSAVLESTGKNVALDMMTEIEGRARGDGR